MQIVFSSLFGSALAPSSRSELELHASRSNWGGLAALSTLSLVLAACTTTTPAPVIDRSARPLPPSSVPAPVRSAPPSSQPAATSSIPAQPSSSGVTIGTAPSPLINERSAPPSTTSGMPLPPVSGTQPGNTPGSQFHVVQRGETLYRIAVNNNLNVDSLAAWNNLNPVAPNIREGQVLRLRAPEEGRSAPPATAGSSTSAPVVVQADGTLLPSTALPTAPLKTEPRAQRLPYSDSAVAQLQRADGQPSAQSTSGTPATGSTATGAAPRSSTESAPASSATATTAPPSTVPGVATSPAAAVPLAGEPEVKPGNGVDRDGVVWTWPTTGRVASKWNDRAAMKGVDLAAKSGTPVVAAAPGKVIYVGKEPRGYGQMIVVSHAKETVSVYFHTDRVQVREQQRVTLGQRLAEVSEGSGNKMHFEVRKQGRPIDPLTLMPSR
jgi:lipoprotein NlpD